MTSVINPGTFDPGPWLSKAQANILLDYIRPAFRSLAIENGSVVVSARVAEETVLITPKQDTSVTLGVGGVVGQPYFVRFIITQPSTGGFPVTFSGNIAWPNGDAPVVSSAASDTTIIKFLTVNGGQTYFGGVN